ncbi:hypothetical protein PoB_001125100 [Plakobranchus ocellatus]|uniref:Uncharacterized protein n=1 Tax=Plakobranchus ocellatus TaxID=259542 RepID=A0AAV3YQR9_9GAST|nr:hypothetical protein PoB_001125100 [Plakobranchus ocellatus]
MYHVQPKPLMMRETKGKLFRLLKAEEAKVYDADPDGYCRDLWGGTADEVFGYEKHPSKDESSLGHSKVPSVKSSKLRLGSYGGFRATETIRANVQWKDSLKENATAESDFRLDRYDSVCAVFVMTISLYSDIGQQLRTCQGTEVAN